MRKYGSGFSRRLRGRSWSMTQTRETFRRSPSSSGVKMSDGVKTETDVVAAKDATSKVPIHFSIVRSAGFAGTSPSLTEAGSVRWLLRYYTLRNPRQSRVFAGSLYFFLNVFASVFIAAFASGSEVFT
jgi:hypothetical protein